MSYAPCMVYNGLQHSPFCFLHNWLILGVKVILGILYMGHLGYIVFNGQEAYRKGFTFIGTAGTSSGGRDDDLGNRRVILHR